jgi:NTE family protein
VESYYPGSTAEAEQNERMNYAWFAAKFKNVGYIQMGSYFSLGYHIQAEATFKPLLSNYYSTIIEATAFQPNILSKSLFMEHYRANQFIALGLMPLYNFGKQVHAKLEAYAFVPVQEILRDQNNKAYLGNYFKSMQTLFNASLNIVTVAGPVSLNVGYITAGENPWSIQLSFGYLLFNKKSADE